MGGTDARKLLAVFAGGMLGALARAGLLEALPHAPGAFPWATLLANVTGALGLGIVVSRLARRPRARAALGPGLCGALTTFSAFQLELVALAEAGRAGVALLYAAASLGAGLVALHLGRRL